MSDVLRRPAKTDAEYKAEAAHISREIDKLFAQMDRDRAESEKLKAETRVISVQLDKILAQLDQQIEHLSASA